MTNCRAAAKPKAPSKGKKAEVDETEVEPQGEEKGIVLGETAKAYLLSKAAERATAVSFAEDLSKNYAVQWGSQNEPYALLALSTLLGQTIYTTGFYSLVNEEGGIEMGGTPDGITADGRVVEIKCPYQIANHLDNVKMANEADLKRCHPKYWAQLQFNMFVSGHTSGVFASFDPRLEGTGLELAIVDVQLDEAWVAEVLGRLPAWLDFIHTEHKTLLQIAQRYLDMAPTVAEGVDELGF